MINQFIYHRAIYELIKDLTQHHDLEVGFRRGGGQYVLRITVRRPAKTFLERLKRLFRQRELNIEITTELFEQQPRGSIDRMICKIESTFKIQISKHVRGIIDEGINI